MFNAGCWDELREVLPPLSLYLVGAFEVWVQSLVFNAGFWAKGEGGAGYGFWFMGIGYGLRV